MKCILWLNVNSDGEEVMSDGKSFYIRASLIEHGFTSAPTQYRLYG